MAYFIYSVVCQQCSGVCFNKYTQKAAFTKYINYFTLQIKNCKCLTAIVKWKITKNLV